MSNASKISILIVNFLLAFVAWKLYKHFEFWGFTFAYVIGGVSVHVINLFDDSAK